MLRVTPGALEAVLLKIETNGTPNGYRDFQKHVLKKNIRKESPKSKSVVIQHALKFE